MKNVIKKLTKPATTILKKCQTKKLVDGKNHIGNGSLVLKRNIVKKFDEAFNKLTQTIETIKFDTDMIVPKYTSDYEVVTDIETREKTTQLRSNKLVVYMSTIYYMYLQKHIPNLKLYVKTAVDPIIIQSNDEIVGVVLPTRLDTSKEILKGDCIIPNLNISIDRCLNTLEIFDVNLLSTEDKNFLKDLGFKYLSKTYYKDYSKKTLDKLNLYISNNVFETEKTLDELKVELDKKEELKRLENNKINVSSDIEVDAVEPETEKCSGENILTGETLETYIKFKPLHFILSSLKIDNEDFKKVDKLVHTIEDAINTGDLFLYKVKKQILSSLKHGDYNKTIDNVNNIYNANTCSMEVYNNIMNDFNYSYNLNKSIEGENVYSKKELKLNDSELETIVNNVVIDMQNDTITKLELIENDIKCTYISKYQDQGTCNLYKSNNKTRLLQVYNKLIDIFNPGIGFDSFTTDVELLKNEISILENRLDNIDSMIQKYSNDDVIRLAYRQIENNAKYALGSANEILNSLNTEIKEDNINIEYITENNVTVPVITVDEVNLNILYDTLIYNVFNEGGKGYKTDRKHVVVLNGQTIITWVNNRGFIHLIVKKSHYRIDLRKNELITCDSLFHDRKEYLKECINYTEKKNIYQSKPIREDIKDDKITISSPENDKIEMNLQLLSSDKPPIVTDFTNIKDPDTLIMITKHLNNDKFIYRVTDDYILYGNPKKCYVLRYFEESLSHSKWINPNMRKGEHKGRISRDLNKLLKLLEDRKYNN